MKLNLWIGNSIFGKIKYLNNKVRKIAQLSHIIIKECDKFIDKKLFYWNLQINYSIIM